MTDPMTVYRVYIFLNLKVTVEQKVWFVTISCRVDHRCLLSTTSSVQPRLQHIKQNGIEELNIHAVKIYVHFIMERIVLQNKT